MFGQLSQFRDERSHCHPELTWESVELKVLNTYRQLGVVVILLHCCLLYAGHITWSSWLWKSLSILALQTLLFLVHDVGSQRKSTPVYQFTPPSLHPWQTLTVAITQKWTTTVLCFFHSLLFLMVTRVVLHCHNNAPRCLVPLTLFYWDFANAHDTSQSTGSTCYS